MNCVIKGFVLYTRHSFVNAWNYCWPIFFYAFLTASTADDCFPILELRVALFPLSAPFIKPQRLIFCVTVILSTRKLTLNLHDIRSCNMTSYYLAYLDESLNKQFCKGSKLMITYHLRAELYYCTFLNYNNKTHCLMLLSQNGQLVWYVELCRPTIKQY